MKVLLFEDNLMWSAKLRQSLVALGHEAILSKAIPTASEGAEVAIVNLSQRVPSPVALVKALHDLGIHTIGHAGHKEQALLQLGREIGVEVLATNSELTFKVGELVAQAQKGGRPEKE